jgi:phosphoribosylamine--glycine ligase
VRFGDPECQVVVPRLDMDLAQLLAEAAHGRIISEPRCSDDAMVTIVLAAEGYPTAPRTGDPIEGIAAARATGALVFCAGVAGTAAAPITAGGRVLTVVGQGPDAATAIGRAYDAVAHVDFAGMQVRSDIGRTVEPALAGIVS